MKVDISRVYAESPRDFGVGDEITVTVRGVISSMSRELVDITALGDDYPQTALGDITIQVEPIAKAMIT